MLEDTRTVDPTTRELRLTWQDPHATAALMRETSGIEALRTLMERGRRPPIMVLMNIWLVEVGDGRIVFEGEPGEEHYNPIGSIHGGFAMTILDSALGCAIHTKLPAGVGYATTDVQTRFIRAISHESGRVRCEGNAIHVGRTTAISEARLTDASGRLLATATTACAIFRPISPASSNSALQA